MPTQEPRAERVPAREQPLQPPRGAGMQGHVGIIEGISVTLQCSVRKVNAVRERLAAERPDSFSVCRSGLLDSNLI